MFEGGTLKAWIASTGSGSVNANGGANALQIWNYANGATIFGTSATERMRITAGGDVGIGTTAPTARLHVDGNVVVTNGTISARVIGAAFQDVAEWVPATTDMEPARWSCSITSARTR